MDSTTDPTPGTIQDRIAQLWSDIAGHRSAADTLEQSIRQLEKGFGLAPSTDPYAVEDTPRPKRRRTRTKRRPARLRDGERRVIGRQAGDLSRVSVTALRVDSETPWVILEIDGRETYLEDCFADELALRIDAALAILPTSK